MFDRLVEDEIQQLIVPFERPRDLATAAELDAHAAIDEPREVQHRLLRRHRGDVAVVECRAAQARGRPDPRPASTRRRATAHRAGRRRARMSIAFRARTSSAVVGVACALCAASHVRVVDARTARDVFGTARDASTSSETPGERGEADPRPGGAKGDRARVERGDRRRVRGGRESAERAKVVRDAFSDDGARGARDDRRDAVDERADDDESRTRARERSSRAGRGGGFGED